MKQETIKKAIKVINRKIKFYQRKLTYQLELKAEAVFGNGNLKVENFDEYVSNIQKYEIILADLATIKRAIKNNQESVKIFGTVDDRDYIYRETESALREAGLDFNGDEFGRLWLFTIVDDEEERIEGTPESWSEFEELQMSMLLDGLMQQYEE